MKAIVAIDNNWGIGKNNDLLVSIPEDMKFFKETTMNKTVVMGRKTLESFPGGKPLKNRKNIVLTRSKITEDCLVCSNMEDVLRITDNDSFVIGGGSIYRQFLPYIDTFYVTKIYKDLEATVFIPNLDELNFKAIPLSEIKEHNGIKYQFFKYQI